MKKKRDLKDQPNGHRSNIGAKGRQAVCHLTFIDKKLSQQRRQLDSVTGVREVKLAVPQKAIHLWVPLYPIEGIALTWHEERN